jgi:hypothetical protein
MYLTYEEYKDMGGKLSETDFLRHEHAARKEIDSLTFNRLQEVEPIPEDLKMCVLELVQQGYCGSLTGEDWTSQGSGKLSGTKESTKGKAAELIRKYLDGMSVNGVPVFYCGN